MVDEELIDSLNMEKVSHSIVMVLGVGGAGGNAVDHMYDMGIDDVSFMICNTDKKALGHSPIPIKVQLGEGLGAGNNPERGRAAAIESIDDIVVRFEQEGTRMVFITAGMGGGTGTGAAPVIAKAARDRGILTVGIVTLPFRNEGKKRVSQAEAGIAELSKYVDSLLVIHNENIKEIYGTLPLTDAFHKADDILATAAKGIAEIVMGDGKVVVDFADVRTVMLNSGLALMGSARAGGTDRARQVAEAALNSPLLNHRDIRGAKNILVNISSGDSEITVDESQLILDYIQEQVRGPRGGEDEANIIWGAGKKDTLGDDIEVTVIVTGFDTPREEAREEDRGTKPVLEVKKPFASVSAQGDMVIRWRAKDRYADIARILDTPAYSRRKVRLVNDTEAGKGGRVALRVEQPEQEPPTENDATLFG